MAVQRGEILPDGIVAIGGRAVPSSNRSLAPWRLWVLMTSADAAGLTNHDLTVPLQVADTSDSVRQGTTGPRQGKKSHLL